VVQPLFAGTSEVAKQVGPCHYSEVLKPFPRENELKLGPLFLKLKMAGQAQWKERAFQGHRKSILR
jgi:hypothetical protein